MRSQEKDFADGLNRGWLNRQLKEDENVRLIGKPVPGTLFHGYDAVMVPFSLAWCAISLLFVTQFSEEDIVFAVFGAVFFVFGLYLLIGRFFHAQIMKRNTDYIVTTKRILRRQGKNADYILLKKIPVVNRSVNRDGTGTITFGREPVEISLVYCRIRMPFYQREKREPVFYLEDVPDVENVYRIITEQVMNEQ